MNMKKIFNKLVRDKIPEIIAADKAVAKTRTLQPEEFIKELFNKAKEEIEELIKTQEDKKEVMKEIGDVYEVLDAIIANLDLSKDEILKLQAERRDKRGGFKKRIFLESIEE
jgi:predicted house-cleaning noncanonical NTP pyrophosphatase (MazG superfamily)